jgi:hypothetical protein
MYSRLFPFFFFLLFFFLFFLAIMAFYTPVSQDCALFCIIHLAAHGITFWHSACSNYFLLFFAIFRHIQVCDYIPLRAQDPIPQNHGLRLHYPHRCARCSFFSLYTAHFLSISCFFLYLTFVLSFDRRDDVVEGP